MSTFLVNQETINKVVSYLFFTVAGDSPIRGPVDRALKSVDINIISDATDLSVAMYGLNVAAVRTRYPDKSFMPPKFVYVSVSCPTDIQAYKLLQCWLYQCNEGDISQTDFYQAMDKILRWIGEKIIYSLPEYQKAYWG